MSASPRTYLFVPANRPERFAKACAAGADRVIVDLEDAVPANEKAAAREALAAWLSPAQPVLIRINSADSIWFAEDLALCSMPGVAGVILPKAEAVDTLQKLVDAGAVTILPLIESARGFAQLRALARAPRVQRLVFGSIDFSFDLGITEGHEELLFFRSQLVFESRLAGIAAPVDGVTTTLDNADILRHDAQRARRLGFGAKLCIHPKQISEVHACFSPTAHELAWARRVLAAASEANGAAVAIDGKMVDTPVIMIAQRMLDEATSITHQ
jgi:citrate lyase subunit beta/citryl-CoA lyase